MHIYVYIYFGLRQTDYESVCLKPKLLHYQRHNSLSYLHHILHDFI